MLKKNLLVWGLIRPSFPSLIAPFGRKYVALSDDGSYSHLEITSVSPTGWLVISLILFELSSSEDRRFCLWRFKRNLQRWNFYLPFIRGEFFVLRVGVLISISRSNGARAWHHGELPVWNRDCRLEVILAKHKLYKVLRCHVSCPLRGHQKQPPTSSD